MTDEYVPHYGDAQGAYCDACEAAKAVDAIMNLAGPSEALPLAFGMIDSIALSAVTSVMVSGMASHQAVRSLLVERMEQALDYCIAILPETEKETAQ